MKQHTGFTLLEMAIALFIIGLLLGNFLVPLSARLDMQRIKRTDKTLEEIKEALLGFALIYGRLPCAAPDKDQDKDGNPIEPKDKGKEHSDWCGKEGYLPWKELGVGRYDGWGNLFRYRGEDEYTTNSIAYNKVFGTSGSGSGLRVRSRQIEDPTKTPPNNYFHLTTKSGDSRVAAIIFSRGKNGVADDDNGNLLMKTYVHDVYVENDFDDILTWLSRNTLANRLIVARKWQP